MGDLDSHERLCLLYATINRLQRVAEQRERRGLDCKHLHELLAALHEHAAATSSYRKLILREDARQKPKLMGLVGPLLPFPWREVLL
jgi:hypothetical protein